MFGLGWMELLIIGGVIMLFAGPAGARKILRMAQDFQKTKADLTGGSALQKLTKIDELIGPDEDAEDAEAPADDRPSAD